MIAMPIVAIPNPTKMPNRLNPLPLDPKLRSAVKVNPIGTAANKTSRPKMKTHRGFLLISPNSSITTATTTSILIGHQDEPKSKYSKKLMRLPIFCILARI